MSQTVESNPDSELIDRLRNSVVSVLRDVVPTGRPVALLDFPRHFNVGDSAIWLGEVAALGECGIRPGDISYVCDLTTYDPSALRHSIGTDGVILLHGGGNFGDIWGRHQRFRERVVAEFPTTRIILLPQSIHFDQQEPLATAAKIFNRHPRLTLLARDDASLRLLDQYFTSDNRLCSDSAFCLSGLVRGIADRDVLHLARTDKEAMGSDDPEGTSEPSDVLSRDWPALGRVWPWRVGTVAGRLKANHPRASRALIGLITPASRFLFDAMARERLHEGCLLLSRGRVVVTDRLHAHILCMLMGIPHVLLDNSYGKIKHFRDAWTSESRLARVAHSREEAFEIAQAMLRDAN